MKSNYVALEKITKEWDELGEALGLPHSELALYTVVIVVVIVIVVVVFSASKFFLHYGKACSAWLQVLHR